MTVNDTKVINVLLAVSEILQEKPSASFKDVIAMPRCKRYSVKEIGEILEFLRRNRFVKASSQFGCSELLKFSATAVTAEGKEILQKLL